MTNDLEQKFINHMKAHLPDGVFCSAILENGEVKPVHFGEAIIWLLHNQDKTKVAKTKIGSFEVSTIFSINCLNGRDDNPFHFETMIFGPNRADVYSRYKTAEDAMRGHQEACTQAKNLDRNSNHT